MPGIIGFEEARRYAELVDRLFGDIGIVPPGISLEVDRPEWAYHKREALFSIGRDAPLNAATISKIRLRNSSVDAITVVTGIVTETSIASSIIAQINTPVVGDLGSVLAAVLLDTRAGNARVLEVKTSLDNTAAVPGAIFWKELVAASGRIIWPPELTPAIVLAPGDSVDVYTDVINVRLLATFVGYHRKARPEELGV